MDWKNRLEQIRNKLKLQLHAKGVDNLLQMQKIFDVGFRSQFYITYNRNMILTSQALWTSLNLRR
jgi:hypothetical protein